MLDSFSCIPLDFQTLIIIIFALLPEYVAIQHNILMGHGSSIRSMSAWHACGPEFDPHGRHILSRRLGHEKISTAILPLTLIQLLAKECALNIGKLPRRLAQEQCGYGN